MEELKKMLESLEGADTSKIIEDIPKIMDKIKDFMPELRDQMANIDAEELVPLAKVVLPAFFEGMTELVENSEEAKEEIEDMEDMRLQMSVPTLDVHMFMIIEGGKFKGGAGKIDNPELKITMDKGTFLNLMKGEGDLVSAYMSGGMSMEGPLNKAMQLQSLFEVIADEYDMDIGIM